MDFVMDLPLKRQQRETFDVLHAVQTRVCLIAPARHCSALLSGNRDSVQSSMRVWPDLNL